MAVRRIVVNTATADIDAARRFYGEIMGLEVLMELTRIRTYGNDHTARVQISFASESGYGTLVPDISIEFDDVDAVNGKWKEAGCSGVDGSADEGQEERAVR